MVDILRPARFLCLVALVAPFIPLTSASAQGRATEWELEVHWGAGFGTAPKSTTALPDVAVAFTTFNGFPSRTVPSWYFGDGAALINARAGSAAAFKITPLDPAFNASSVRAGVGHNVGGRIRRPISPRLSIEISVDYSSQGLALTGDARAAVEQSRATFATAFNSILAGQISRTVSSNLTIDDPTSGQMVATGGLTVNLHRTGRVMPYVTVGGGVLLQTGDPTRIALAGDYQYTSASNTVYRQTDHVDVRYSSDAMVVLLGGIGFTRAISPRSGLRFDYRIHLGRDTTHVLANASPKTIPGVQLNTFSFGGSPAIQISTAGATSTLSALFPTLDTDVTTTTGLRTLSALTFGYFWRF